MADNKTIDTKLIIADLKKQFDFDEIRKELEEEGEGDEPSSTKWITPYYPSDAQLKFMNAPFTFSKNIQRNKIAFINREVYSGRWFTETPPNDPAYAEEVEDVQFE